MSLEEVKGGGMAGLVISVKQLRQIASRLPPPPGSVGGGGSKSRGIGPRHLRRGREDRKPIGPEA